MKLAGALVLLGAVLLLTSEGDCGLCPVIEKKVDLFLYASQEEYLEYVKQFEDNPAVLEDAANIKTCVDNTLTEDDKKHINDVIVSL
ncbi:major allergen I polypeptide chain 1-like [Mastomys coucha]|uniref:major allergen I polypeptide chain 1-like n=1 Tax=Mastomys coucha TaxID=35658 RepID=UPI0012621980|nr:major allergen I polypeptide chain 1-like [Mastomys coucha]